MLGVPCLTVRESTERPITITHGSNTLVGTSGTRIIASAVSILDSDPVEYARPALWDGRAAERVSAVVHSLDDSFPRPTDLMVAPT